MNRTNLNKKGIWPVVKRPASKTNHIIVWRIAFVVSWGLVIIINVMR